VFFCTAVLLNVGGFRLAGKSSARCGRAKIGPIRWDSIVVLTRHIRCLFNSGLDGTHTFIYYKYNDANTFNDA